MSRSIREAWELALRKKAEASSITEGRNAPAAAPEADPVDDSILPPTSSAAGSRAGPSDERGQVKPPRIVTGVAEGAKFNVKFAVTKARLLPGSYEEAGKRLQIPEATHHDERELTLGFDFGTSCTKVIIGDAAAGKSYAVPFHDDDGVGRYLLASRVFERSGNYSLADGEIVHRDLKLAFIDGRDGDDGLRKVVAFLALVLRRARGWLLKEHHDVYRDTRVLWRFAMGLPTRQSFDGSVSQRFKHLALASWHASRADGSVTKAVVDDALARVAREGADSTEVDVHVMPEIAAQIYGFVVSDSFDRKGRNIFLIADVGAGTVDASLFHVREIKGKRHNFSFYTSTVEFNGVSNLHRHRCSWWASALRAVDVDLGLLREIEESQALTDHDLQVPEDFRCYCDGVTIDESAMRSPDDEFFGRVEQQVVTDTFIRALQDHQVPRHQLADVPFYLCGGGSRMQYYGRLKQRLQHLNVRFGINAIPTPLTIPENLEVEAIANDYDRLSVAYGLGWLDPGWVVETEPMRPLDDQAPAWRGNFVDKDQV